MFMNFNLSHFESDKSYQKSMFKHECESLLYSISARENVYTRSLRTCSLLNAFLTVKALD